jgi:thiamine-phosphate pyrophosphorylase
VQLRLKDADDDALRRACDLLRPVAHDRGVAFILNDRPDLVAETGCDGAHIGSDDMPYAEARRHIGPDAILGVSCYDSRHRAMAAAEAGADYVAFGAFYPTLTKEPRGRPTPDLLTDWQVAVTVPCVAIGGIKIDNCAPLVRAGADFLAVVTAIWDHVDGPGAAVAAFNAAIAGALQY